MSKKIYQSSFTSFTTCSTLAMTILKLLQSPSQSARVLSDPIYARGRERERAKKASLLAFKKKTIDIKLSTDDSCHAQKPSMRFTL